MFNKKEISSILIITIFLAFSISLKNNLSNFPYIFLPILLVIFINIIAKKVVASHFETEIEANIWEIKRKGILYFIYKKRKSHPSKKFKTPLQTGLLLPIISTLITFGHITWLASLVFKTKPRIERAAKRHGVHSFMEVSEYHVALIAAGGIIANLTFSLLGYLIGFPEFSKFNIYYAFFNMLPLSKLDGNKIFFGSLTLWSLLASFVIFALGLSFAI